MRLAHETVRQRSLADPRLTGQERDARTATTRLRGLGQQAGQLIPPSDEGPIGAATLAFGAGFPVLVVGSALVGLGGGLFTLLAAAIAVEFGAAAVGRAFGLCMAFIPLTALAPFVTAKTQESTGSYVPALLGLATLVLISGGLSLLLRERGRDDQPA